MTNEKALVFGETIGLGKKSEQLHFKPYRFRNQCLCSFCARELTDGAVRFKGIAACASCLERWKAFDENLRQYLKERTVKYESS